MNSYKFLTASDQYAELFHEWRQSPTAKAANPLKDETVDEVRQNLLGTGSDLSDRSFDRYRFFLECDGNIIANASLKCISWDQGFGEIGYGVDPNYFGQGIGTIVARMAVEKVFRETDLVRLVATASVTNTASIEILEKTGFKREGRLREHFLIQGNRVDQFTFGLMRHEWQSNQST